MRVSDYYRGMLELMNRTAYVIDAAPRRLFRALFPETPRPEDYFWSEVTSLWQPHVRLTDGTWSVSGGGTLWRRRREADGCWEYEQDAETLQQQLRRMG
jgi:hypothetical protein